MSSTISKTARTFSVEDLHAYQHKTKDFIKATPFCALWITMGMGKTVSTLTALQELYDEFELDKVLIIAPLRVTHHVWPDEIAQWGHIDLDYTVIKGSPKQREELLKRPTTIHMINRELVVWLVEHYKDKWPYETVIIDESSSFKRHTSQRFKHLRRVLPYTERMVHLTGSPAPNGLMDLWAPTFLLDRGKRLGKTITGYRDQFFVSDYMGFNYTLRKGAKEQIYGRLKDICLTLDRKDYFEVEDRPPNVIKIELPAALKAQYKELEKDFLLEVGDDSIEAFNAAALSMKLRQFCNGVIYGEDKKQVPVHDLKMDALESVIEEAAGEPVFVGYEFRSDRERILKKFKFAVPVDEKGAIERWNRGEIKLLLAHPASAAHGLNLQHGGHIICWFGLPWDFELFEQFNARIDRQGQTEPVIQHHIVVTDSVEEDVAKALQDKNSTQEELKNALKSGLNRRNR